jgi:hypothetical protein
VNGERERCEGCCSYCCCDRSSSALPSFRLVLFVFGEFGGEDSRDGAGETGGGEPSGAEIMVGRVLECACERLGCGGAFVGVLGEGPECHGCDLWGETIGSRQRRVDLRVENGERVVCLVGLAACEQLEENDACRVEVASCVDCLAFDLLGAHVGRAAFERSPR